MTVCEKCGGNRVDVLDGYCFDCIQEITRGDGGQSPREQDTTEVQYVNTVKKRYDPRKLVIDLGHIPGDTDGKLKTAFKQIKVRKAYRSLILQVCIEKKDLPDFEFKLLYGNGNGRPEAVLVPKRSYLSRYQYSSTKKASLRSDIVLRFKEVETTSKLGPEKERKEFEDHMNEKWELDRMIEDRNEAYGAV